MCECAARAKEVVIFGYSMITVQSMLRAAWGGVNCQLQAEFIEASAAVLEHYRTFNHTSDSFSSVPWEKYVAESSFNFYLMLYSLAHQY